MSACQFEGCSHKSGREVYHEMLASLKHPKHNQGSADRLLSDFSLELECAPMR